MYMRYIYTTSSRRFVEEKALTFSPYLYRQLASFNPALGNCMCYFSLFYTRMSQEGRNIARVLNIIYRGLNIIN